MKRAVLIAVLAFLVPLWPGAGLGRGGTVLDLDSLPKDWILAGYYTAQKHDLESFRLSWGLLWRSFGTICFRRPRGICSSTQC